MKKLIGNLGYYIQSGAAFVFLVWAWSVMLGLAIRLTAYAWGIE